MGRHFVTSALALAIAAHLGGCDGATGPQSGPSGEGTAWAFHCPLPDGLSADADYALSPDNPDIAYVSDPDDEYDIYEDENGLEWFEVKGATFLEVADIFAFAEASVFIDIHADDGGEEGDGLKDQGSFEVNCAYYSGADGRELRNRDQPGNVLLRYYPERLYSKQSILDLIALLERRPDWVRADAGLSWTAGPVFVCDELDADICGVP